MKKILLISCLLLLLSGCNKNKMINTGIKIDDYDLLISKDNDCKVKEYYERNNIKIYLICLNNVYLSKNKQISLKEYLEKSNSSLFDNINKITESLEYDSSFYDGGSTIYRDGGSKKVNNEDLTILKCNTIDGNKDIYISLNDINVNNLCKRKVSIINSSNTSKYLFDSKNDIQKLNSLLRLNNYGKFNFYIKKNTLYINYYEVEGWGNILDKNDILLEKSSILLSLIKDIDNIEWTANNKSKNINLKMLNKKYGYIKDYGENTQTLNSLLIKLNYKNNPISLEIKDKNKEEFILNIINNTNANFLYGEYYILEKNVNNQWITINSNQVFNSIGYTLVKKSTRGKKYRFLKTLDKGTYRIVINFDEILNQNEDGFNFDKSYYIIKEFSI